MFRIVYQTYVQLLHFALGACLGLFVLSLTNCSRLAGPHSPATNSQLDSVVTLVEKRTEFCEPSLASDGFDKHTGAYVSRWAARCNAFAMQRDNGEIYLVTAQHCTRYAAIGTVLRYLPPDGYGIDSATLVHADEARDYAELRIERRGGLVPLQRGPAPVAGTPVLSVSALFSEQSLGRSLGPLSGSWHETSQRIDRGWSGSPVLTYEQGPHGPRALRVWGFLSKCESNEAGQCATGAIVGAL